MVIRVNHKLTDQETLFEVFDSAGIGQTVKIGCKIFNSDHNPGKRISRWGKSTSPRDSNGRITGITDGKTHHLEHGKSGCRKF